MATSILVYKNDWLMSNNALATWKHNIKTVYEHILTGKIVVIDGAFVLNSLFNSLVSFNSTGQCGGFIQFFGCEWFLDFFETFCINI